MKKTLLAVFALGLALTLGQECHAQIIIAPPASPFFRPGIDTRTTFLYGGPRTMFQPGMVTQSAPTQVPGQMPVEPMGMTTARPGYDYNSPMVTGHPTRFNAYGGYFNNQGGGLTVSSPTPPTARGPQSAAVGASSSASTTPTPRAPSQQGKTTRTPAR